MTQLDGIDFIAVRIQPEWSYQQYVQLLLFSVLPASALIRTNDERSPRNSSSRDVNRNRDQTE